MRLHLSTSPEGQQSGLPADVHTLQDRCDLPETKTNRLVYQKIAEALYFCSLYQKDLWKAFERTSGPRLNKALLINHTKNTSRVGR